MAHGGVAGAIVESLVVLAVVGILVWVWLRERRLHRERVTTDDESPSR